jgi:hypothetical protein
MVAFKRFVARFSLDLVGFSASAICALHCLALPFILMFTSFGASPFVHHHMFENVIFVISAAVGTSALIPSYRNHHRRLLPLLLFLGGFASVLIGRTLFSQVLVEVFFTVPGAIMISIAHLFNWTLCRPYHSRN